MAAFRDKLKRQEQLIFVRQLRKRELQIRLGHGCEPKTRLADLKQYRWQTHCRGLVQLPMAT